MTRLRQLPRSAGRLFLPLLCSCLLLGCLQQNEKEEYPGFTRASGNVYLMENHCHALLAWHMQECRNTTLVHIDAHDDCRPISEEHFQTASQLLEDKDYDEIFRMTDTSSFLNLKLRDREMIYDLGNFIYPALKLGLVSNVYWVVPQPRIVTSEHARLLGVIQHSLPGATLTETAFPAGGFEVSWGGRLVRIVTLEDLPRMEPGAILDLDLDFFAFPKAMTEEHLLAQVNRNPVDVLEYLHSQVPDPKAVTISASVWGGYLPLLVRFLADASYDYYCTGHFPEDATMLLESYRSIKSGAPAPPSVSNSTYTAASYHFQALTMLSRGDVESCRSMLDKASSSLPVYKKGFLDAAEALISMGRYTDASSFIDHFEQLSGGRTYNSLATRVQLNLAYGKPAEALRFSTQLVEWDANPYTLLLHGSALNANGKSKAAEKTFRELLDTDPSNAAAHFNIGAIRQAAGDLDGAVTEYQTAILRHPTFWQALENLGHIELQHGDPIVAESILKMAVKANPYSVTSLNNLGMALMRQSKFKEAAGVLKEAALMMPDNQTVQLNLATALLRVGKADEAAVICRKLLQTNKSKEVLELLQAAEKN